MKWIVSESEKQQYRERGFFVLEGVVGHDDLQMLRATCDELVAAQDAAMDRLGVDELELSRRGSRYFVFLASKEHKELAPFLFSDMTEQICRATVGENALLFWEQFVVKGGRDVAKSTFSWHQDAGYVDGLPVPHYVNAWVALDDVTEDNGTVYLLPYAEAGTRERVEHRIDLESGDRVGYFGDRPGIPVVAPAGSVAIFSSTTFHRSGANTTDRYRRAYALQFAEAPVHREDGSIMGLTETFLKDGRRLR
jgi:ectoine hydroxylase-related dioxygenase (phytanoyl-CoA dioxygenase family)